MTVAANKNCCLLVAANWVAGMDERRDTSAGAWQEVILMRLIPSVDERLCSYDCLKAVLAACHGASSRVVISIARAGDSW